MNPVINPREVGFIRLDLREVFGNGHPTVLEIGSGSGRFLIGAAMERPERNYIGVEKSLHYHRVMRDRVQKRAITNIRIVNHDAFLVMRDMLPDESIAEIHVYFPDPWPRTRERKRRIIRPEALLEMRRVLLPGGTATFVTDHKPYFEVAAPAIAAIFPSEVRLPGPDQPPRTNYEAKYRQEGRPIYEVRFWRA